MIRIPGHVTVPGHGPARGCVTGKRGRRAAAAIEGCRPLPVCCTGRLFASLPFALQRHGRHDAHRYCSGCGDAQGVSVRRGLLAAQEPRPLLRVAAAGGVGAAADTAAAGCASRPRPSGSGAATLARRDLAPDVQQPQKRRLFVITRCDG